METARKYSRKREAILSLLHESKEHPSAEMIYSSLKPLFPDLSLGTVYRNLSMFIESGEVVKVCNVNGQERYDATTEPHAHFICESCSRVIDLCMEAKIQVLYASVEADTGGRVHSHNLCFSGRCADCLSE